MKIFGFEIKRAAPMPVRSNGGWFGVIRESFAGAWQANIEVDAPRDILSYAGLYAPLTLIAGDIGTETKPTRK